MGRVGWVIAVGSVVACTGHASDQADGGTTSGSGSDQLTTFTTGPATTVSPDDDTTGPATTSGGQTSSLDTDDTCDTCGATDTRGDDSTGDSGGPPDVAPWGDCINNPAEEACGEHGWCLLDESADPPYGVCLPAECEVDEDCPAPLPFAANLPTCTDVDDDGTTECVQPCVTTSQCPSFMRCHDLVCTWPLHGFAECMDDPSVCLPGEECLVFDAPPFSVCSATSCNGDPDLCPLPPPGGSAPVTCDFDFDIDGADDCKLDCSGGQACPTGMVCQGFELCVWLAGVDLPCADYDLGSVVGGTVASGSTVGAGDDFAASCTPGNDEDLTFAWTAPASQPYFFTTGGSSFDTILYVHDGCTGVELGCTSTPFQTGSDVIVFLDAGQTVLIVVDGFNDSGDFVLGIYQ